MEKMKPKSKKQKKQEPGGKRADWVNRKRATRRLPDCPIQVLLFTDRFQMMQVQLQVQAGKNPPTILAGIQASSQWRYGQILHPPKEKKTKRNASRWEDDGTSGFFAIQFRGKPTPEQAAFFCQNIGNCRALWNRMLGDFLEKGTFLTPAQYKKLPGMEWLKLGDSQGLANVQLNFQSAVSDYQAGKKGRPHFKKKRVCKDSYKTNLSNKKKPNLYLKGNLLHLPKLKSPVKLIKHRDIPEGYFLKNCTVTHERSGDWTFSLVFEYEAVQSLAILDKEAKDIRHIGLDMSLPKLYVDSEGKEADFIKPYRKLEKRIAREQRKLSHMVYGSKNYIKQKQKIEKLHAKAKHQRSDCLHKLSCMLTDQYDLISIEDLDIAALKKALHFGKSLSDNGWGKFVEMLCYKAEKKGKFVIQVDKWFPSSKTCSCCGYVHKELKLSDREYECPACGNLMDRDEQAAINLDREGLRIFLELYQQYHLEKPSGRMELSSSYSVA